MFLSMFRDMLLQVCAGYLEKALKYHDCLNNRSLGPVGSGVNRNKDAVGVELGQVKKPTCCFAEKEQEKMRTRMP